MTVTEHQILVFFLIWVRVSALFLSAPVFGTRGIPLLWKIGFSGLVGLLLYPVVEPTVPDIALEWWTVAVLVGREILAGVSIGLVLMLLFAAVVLAGEYIGMDMGFSMVQEFDPSFQSNISILGRFNNILAMLVFLLLDGHHLLLQAMALSYRTVPIGTWSLSQPAIHRIMAISGKIFAIGLQIAAPAVVTLFLTSVAMGIIARAVPQMNIFFVGFPLRIFAGLASLMLGLPLFLYVFKRLLEVFQSDVLYLLRVM
ncbi:MAG: flagellar type III secretion system protein FliR [Calditrichaeota bacterium]|nr:MAG: flagellar type III secretion system protein FliR [Calditrichota bacterium]